MSDTLYQLPGLIACNGNEINCTLGDGAVEADPDIAGIGVILSFILTSFVAFVAIIVGYLTYSIESKQTNDVDAVAIRSLRRLLRMGSGAHITNETRKRRTQVLTSFILSLSDQQLVTGLAILITGYYQRCTISGYHFVLIANLAWFSSTTHLSTLAVLQEYLIRRPVLKTFRVVGMLCLLGLLFHAQLYVQWYVYPSLPVQCTFTKGFQNLGSADYLLFIEVVEWISIVAFLFLAYANSMVKLYATPPVVSVYGWVEESIRKMLELAPELSRRERYNRSLDPLYTSPSRTRPNGLPQLLLARYTWSQFLGSFLWNIVWMVFGNVFGLLQICSTRWGTPSVDLTGFQFYIVGSENTWGFGQMVALLLLTLPILAAGEAYSEFQRPRARPETPEPTSADQPRANPPAHEDLVLGRDLGKVLLVVFICVTGILVFFAVEAGWYFGRGSIQVVTILATLILLFAFVLFAQLLSSIAIIRHDLGERRVETGEEGVIRGHELQPQVPADA